MIESDGSLLAHIAESLIDVSQPACSLTECVAYFDIPQDIEIGFDGDPKPALLLLLTEMMPGAVPDFLGRSGGVGHVLRPCLGASTSLLGCSPPCQVP
jgi:hypothetical protein